ncbi:MAG TPA: hypothetical protein VKC66_20775 [Xanthobacteraceae bacterium]|nr:hypothetical protein [Xanthobacteraceae bacterium]
MRKEVIHAGNVTVTGAGSMRAVTVGSRAFCSGASLRDPNQGQTVAEDGFRLQAKRVQAQTRFWRLQEGVSSIVSRRPVTSSMPMRTVRYSMEFWGEPFERNLPGLVVVDVTKLRENCLLKIEGTACNP